jgi:hypothetical protein
MRCRGAQHAHAEHNKVKATCTHAKYLPQRRAMMQAWADHLDALRASRSADSISTLERRAAAVAGTALFQPDPDERLR